MKILLSRGDNAQACAHTRVHLFSRFQQKNWVSSVLPCNFLSSILIIHFKPLLPVKLELGLNEYY